MHTVIDKMFTVPQDVPQLEKIVSSY